MIVGSNFPFDSTRLAMLQHDVYGNVAQSQEQYRKAEAILGIRAELGKRLPVDSFDHRRVQYVHDQIAAQFRYLYINKSRLFASHEADEEPELFLKEWNDYLRRELETVVDWRPDFYRLVCVAVAFPNPDEKGVEAEKALCEIMDEKYQTWLS